MTDEKIKKWIGKLEDGREKKNIKTPGDYRKELLPLDHRIEIFPYPGDPDIRVAGEELLVNLAL